MSFEITKNKNWVVFSIKDRLDSFNCEDFKQKMDQVVRDKESKVALHLTETEFLSLPVIKYFSGIASDITNSGGEFALVGPPEKLKRQIDIFASLKPMQVFRSAEDWESQI